MDTRMTVTPIMITPTALEHYLVSCTILTVHATLILQNRKLRHSKHLGWNCSPGNVAPAFKCILSSSSMTVSLVSTWQV